MARFAIAIENSTTHCRLDQFFDSASLDDSAVSSTVDASILHTTDGLLKTHLSVSGTAVRDFFTHWLRIKFQENHLII